jgi:hypothetical protein
VCLSRSESDLANTRPLLPEDIATQVVATNCDKWVSVLTCFAAAQAFENKSATQHNTTNLHFRKWQKEDPTQNPPSPWYVYFTIGAVQESISRWNEFLFFFIANLYNKQQISLCGDKSRSGVPNCFHYSTSNSKQVKTANSRDHAHVLALVVQCNVK